MKAETKKISIKCIIRNYTYTAHVSKATGRLLKITAGCRTWKSFELARDHYRGFGLGCGWSDQAINDYSTSPWKRFAHRLEARRILDRLDFEVGANQRRLREQKRKARR